jgi:hypothetical protein
MLLKNEIKSRKKSGTDPARLANRFDREIKPIGKNRGQTPPG